MKKIFLPAAACVLLAFTSCKKDKETTPGNGTPAKLLTKLAKTENNKTTVFNLLYDGNKRLTSYKSADNQVGIIFTYDANGNVTKVEDTEDDFKNIYTYTYNNGVPVSGTFKCWQKTAGEPDELIENDQLTYTVTNNQVSKIHIAFALSADAADFTLTYGTNGNLVKAVSTGITGYTASFGYGTKKPVFPIVSKYILDQAGFSLQFAAKNELLTIGYDFPGTQFDYSVTNQYTYDANGYVLTSSDGDSQISFEYQ
jgi:YD repeat-containing protein